MSDQSHLENGYTPLDVRKALDKVLAHEVSSLIDIDSGTAVGAYNLTTLACIIVAVEREREIITFSDSPPERYTRQSFIEELAQIGINSEEVLDEDVASVADMGYLSFTGSGDLQAEASAYTMAGFLNTMFPGMQGMNLIAFVMQMNDEVISGRKTLELAKKSFAQTLKSRGIAVTREKAEAAVRAAQTSKEISAPSVSTAASSIASPGNRAVSRQLKESAAKRIASLRSRRSLSKPSVYSSIGHGAGKSKVKDVFDKGPSEEALAAEQERQMMEQKDRELAELQERLRQAEERAGQLSAREKSLKQAQDAAEEAEQKARKFVADETAAMAEKKAELRAMEKKVKAAEEQIRLEKEAMEKAVIDGEKAREEIVESEPEPAPELEEDLESRIAAFEAGLAMPCPLCHEGKIVPEKTAKDKTYYTCSNKACRFVSWDKPYHFECPLCKNPFLTEFTTATGEKGLKCPRAACIYTQNNLLEPRLNQPAEAKPIKKKKKLVRRVKRRS